MTNARTIAIDGPAGCGKTTLGHRLAARLDYFFLDSGILYRAIARHAMNVGVQIYEPESVEAYAETLTINVTRLRPRFQFEINDTKVRKLNTLQIDKVTPTLAAYPGIRARVRQVQREIATEGELILAGRDIGTVVLPDAGLKIFLDVSLEERAQRRFLYKNQEERTLEQITQDLLLRDLADSTREESPMVVPEGAVVLNTEGMDVEDVVELALQHIQKMPSCATTQVTPEVES